MTPLGVRGWQPTPSTSLGSICHAPRKLPLPCLAADDAEEQVNEQKFIQDCGGSAGEVAIGLKTGSQLIQGCAIPSEEQLHVGGVPPCTQKVADQVLGEGQVPCDRSLLRIQSGSNVLDDGAAEPGQGTVPVPRIALQQAAAVAAPDCDFEKLWLRAQCNSRPLAPPLRRSMSLDDIRLELLMQQPPVARGPARWLPPGSLQWLMAAVSQPNPLGPKGLQMLLPPKGARSAAVGASLLQQPHVGPPASQGSIRLDFPLHGLALPTQHGLDLLPLHGLDASPTRLAPDSCCPAPCTTQLLPPGCTSRPLHFPESLAASPAPRCDLEHLLLAATPVVATSKPMDQLLLVSVSIRAVDG